MYSFQKWLMIGLALLVFASIFSQFPLESSIPDVTDYDITDEKDSQQYLDDVDSYQGQVALFGAMSTILQTGSLALVAYGFIREAHEEDHHHVALRITFVLSAVISSQALLAEVSHSSEENQRFISSRIRFFVAVHEQIGHCVRS